jgi:hypothetical protein
LKKKRDVGSAHRKRVARQGWWLSGPIPTRGGGVPVLEHPLDGVMVLRGGCARAVGVGSRKERGRGEALGGRGASTAVGRHGVVGSGAHGQRATDAETGEGVG